MTGGSTDCVPGSATYDSGTHVMQVTLNGETWAFHGAAQTHTSTNLTHFALTSGGSVQIHTGKAAAKRAASARGAATVRQPCGCRGGR